MVTGTFFIVLNKEVDTYKEDIFSNTFSFLSFFLNKQAILSEITNSNTKWNSHNC